MKKKKQSVLKRSQLLTWVEIDLKAIAHNFNEIQRLSKRQKEKPFSTLAVVKDDAYGHGAGEVSKLLEKKKVDYFAVADVDEAILLRFIGIKKPILVFKTTLASQVGDVFHFKLTPTVCTIEFARHLNRLAQKKKRVVNVHVKIDTGMGRLGVWHKDAVDFIVSLKKLKNLSVQGIYTHFPVSDTNKKFTTTQMNQVRAIVKQLKEKNIVVPYVHTANSTGLMTFKQDTFNLARPGLMLYGMYQNSQSKRNANLKSAMSVKSRIIFIKKIAKGRSIGYGRTFIAKRNMTVATLSIGYNDGYLRALSNKADCLVNAKRCRVLGRISMDQVVVDVTNVKGVNLGMIATILGRDKKSEVSAEELAKRANTINYEIVCSFGNRLPRVYY